MPLKAGFGRQRSIAKADAHLQGTYITAVMFELRCSELESFCSIGGSSKGFPPCCVSIAPKSFAALTPQLRIQSGSQSPRATF